ncbi:MAG: DMT family transporter [Bacteroidetes bacterium]|nr:DMT family transporter [Bacteroidota bacterium]
MFKRNTASKLKIRQGKLSSVIVLIALSIIWGSSFILIKKGLESFSPGQVGTIRIVFAFIVLLPFAIKHIKTTFKYHWKKLFFLGLISNLIPAVLFAKAETELTSSLTGILNSLTPIFTLIAGALAFKIQIKSKQTLGLMIGLAGSIGLTFINNQGGIGSFNFYVLFVIAATILYGISANMVKAYFAEINSAVLTSTALLGVGPLALAYLLSTDFIYRLSENSATWYSLGYLFLLGAVGTALALVFFNKLIQQTSAVFASTVTYLIPIIAVVWGIVDGEQIYAFHLLGMAVIIVGVYIVNKAK